MKAAEIYNIIKRIISAPIVGKLDISNTLRVEMRGRAPIVPMINPTVVYINSSINIMLDILPFDAPSNL